MSRRPKAHKHHRPRGTREFLIVSPIWFEDRRRPRRLMEIKIVPWSFPFIPVEPVPWFWHFEWGLFASVFAITFVAELPDKTAFAALILATKGNPWAILIGSAAAFLCQSVIAVSCGGLIGLLPASVVKIGSGIVFIVLAGFMWFRKEPGEEELNLEKARGKFARTIWVSFLVIFIAEWGDLTQFSTAILAAKHGHEKIITIFVGATLALWAVTALAILIGNRAKKAIHPMILQKIAAVAFAVVGVLLLTGVGWPEH